ncbi:DNA-binding protein [Pseudanabaena sp. FACHB-2040]|nr:DNA-binding protein [Pseudanabaena sp. FACHB-2040]
MTEAAATLLGISAEQLRHLRRSGLFKAGHHYRDTSIPGSGKPRWQWHVERCAQALAVPPEKREIRG